MKKIVYKKTKNLRKKILKRKKVKKLNKMINLLKNKKFMNLNKVKINKLMI